MNKVNPFLTLTAPALLVAIAPCPLTFLSNLSNTEELALVAKLGKTSLAKETQQGLIMLFCQT